MRGIHGVPERRRRWVDGEVCNIAQHRRQPASTHLAWYFRYIAALFWLSLVPFVTGWMSENHFAAVPVALYGAVMLMSGVAYYILARILVAQHGRDSALSRALGRDVKGIVSVVVYAIAIALAFVAPWAACALYVLVAIMWLIPDPRIEHQIENPNADAP